MLILKRGDEMKSYRTAEKIKNDFTKGTRIFIDYISDNSYPKAVGHYGTVEFVDDAGQVHCKMADGSTATVCKEYGDVFFKAACQGVKE